jgi:hypothetical protein
MCLKGSFGEGVRGISLWSNAQTCCTTARRHSWPKLPFYALMSKDVTIRPVIVEAHEAQDSGFDFKTGSKERSTSGRI